MRKPLTLETIQELLVGLLANWKDLDAAAIDVTESFEHYGVSSRDAVALTGELEDVLGREISPTVLWEFPSIAALARHLAGEAEEHSGNEPDLGREKREPIAIIGMGCRFPGADGPEAFWNLLVNGVDAVTEVPEERWSLRRFYSADPSSPGKVSTRWGGFLRDVDRFDADFFGIAPREAMAMDPQQRIILEVAWEALEDAGQVPKRLAGSRTGVFMGVSISDYGRFQLSDPQSIDAYSGTGSAMSIVANRLSFFFDFKGPSVVVDTACSSSLVAVHLALRSLWSGESTLALAGGVNLLLSPSVTINFSKAGAMAPDGRCKAFDERANGYVRSEGAGVVVLKPLSAALRDGDPVYAVILGSAVNQDGRTNGLMAPNPQSQKELLRQAFRDAGVSPGAVSYVECHGTGTLLGDPIEAESLGSVLAEDRPPERPCLIGSAKTNIGHLEAAAGVAGLIKTALALKHGMIPPSLHFVKPNPYIPFERLPIRVQTSHAPWPKTAGPRIAGVNSFGFGGTNVHVVLQEAPRTDAGLADPKKRQAAHRRPVRVLPLSAHSPEALRQTAETWREWLAETPLDEADLCYTAAVRRQHHCCRLAVVGNTKQEFVERLAAWVNGEAASGTAQGTAVAGQRPKLAFVFPGQGSQWLGMARELLDSEPVFRECVEACERAMKHEVDWSLGALLRHPCEHESLLERIDVIQPTLFAIQVSLVRLWESLGVRPDAVVGHSMGEVAAAHAAGRLTLEDAVKVICRRSKLLRRLSGQGAMAVVELPADKAEAALGDEAKRVSVAVINSRRSTVLAGDPQALRTVTDRLEAQGVFCRWVKVDVASHSPQMDALMAELKAALAEVAPQTATIPMISTVGETAVCDASYWAENLRRPVRFAQAIEALLDQGYRLFVEISPHPILLAAVQETAGERNEEAVVLPSMRRGEPQPDVLMESLSMLYCVGYPLEWERLYPAGRCLPLPRYAWQRERYWLERVPQELRPPHAESGTEEEDTSHPLIGARLSLADVPDCHIFQTVLSPGKVAWLDDHRIGEMPILSASVLIDMLAAAMESGECALGDVRFHRPLALTEARMVQLSLRDGQLRLLSRPSAQRDAAWTLHVTATSIKPGMATPAIVREAGGTEPTAGGASVDEAAAPSGGGAVDQQGERLVSPDAHYSRLEALGVTYGPAFRTLSRLAVADGTAVGEAALAAEHLHEAKRHLLHPSLLDAALQAACWIAGEEDGLYLPASVRRLRIYAGKATRVTVQVVRRDHRREGIEADIQVWNEDGNLIARMDGVHYQPVNRDVRSAGTAAESMALGWQEWRGLDVSTEDRGRWEKGTWLILADREGIGRVLQERLGHLGCRAVLIEAEERFERIGEDVFTVHPADPNGLKAVLQTVFAGEAAACRGIVHLWSLGVPSLDDAEPDWERVRRLGVGSVPGLVRAVESMDWAIKPRMWLVTRGGQRVGPETSPLAIAQSPVWGLGGVLAVEHPDWWGGLIDLDPDETGEQANVRAAKSLLAALGLTERENRLAVRGGRVFVPRLTACSSKAGQKPTWRSDASYLITGGLGGLGLEVARWMVRQGARRLILMGRTPLPERTEWNGLDPSTPAGKRIAAVRELEAMGASVHLAAVDVADESSLSRFLAEYERALWPPIRGVIHAAGVIDDRLALDLDEDSLAGVLRPKWQGAWNLHRAFPVGQLDLFVLFSSLGALVGFPGQASYASANAFLDALARFRREAGDDAAVSVNWPVWDSIGFAATQGGERVAGYLKDNGLPTLDTEQGLQALSFALGQRDAQVIVLPGGVSAWRNAGAGLQLPQLFAGAAGPTEQTEKSPSDPIKAAGSLAAMDRAERRAWLERQVREAAAEVTKVPADRFDPAKPFGEYGMDSIMALDLRRRLEARIGLELSVTLLWSYPTVQALAGYLDSRFAPGETIGAQAAVAEAVAAALADVETGGRMASGAGRLLAEIEQETEESMTDRDILSLIESKEA